MDANMKKLVRKLKELLVLVLVCALLLALQSLF